MSKIVGIVSIKGGVGKTTTTVSLAGALAKEFGKKVLIIDANFTAPNLGLHLGYVKPEHTIHNVLSGDIAIEDAIYQSEYGFHVIAGSLLHECVNPLLLKSKIAPLRELYDIILLDSSPTLNDEILSVMMASDELFCVTTPDYPTLSCTLRALKHAKDNGTHISGLILNKLRNKKFELSISEIEDASECSIVAVVPDDTRVLKALALTTPSTMLHNRIQSTVEFTKLAGALVDEDYHDSRFRSRFFSLVGKTSKQDSNRELLRNSGNASK